MAFFIPVFLWTFKNQRRIPWVPETVYPGKMSRNSQARALEHSYGRSAYLPGQQLNDSHRPSSRREDVAVFHGRLWECVEFYARVWARGGGCRRQCSAGGSG